MDEGGSSFVEQEEFPEITPPVMRTLIAQVGAAVTGASIQMVHSPLAYVLGAASIPVLAALGTEIATRRLKAIRQGLDINALDGDAVIRAILENESAFDLFRRVVRASLESGYDAKRILLSGSLVRGLTSTDDALIDVELRLVRTMERIDLLEARLLGIIASGSHGANSRQPGAADRRRLIQSYPQAHVVLDAVLATLESEGLVENVGRRSNEGEDAWHVTDYGNALLQLLRDSSKTGEEQV